MTIDEELRTKVLAIFAGYKHVFLSGSRAFGWSTDTSDFDICVYVDDKDRAFALLDTLSKEVAKSEYYDSRKGVVEVDVRGKTFAVCLNPIPLHPLDMLCWGLATKEIQHLAEINPKFLGVKEHRHGVFETFRGLYKMTIPYEGADAVGIILDREQGVEKSSPE